MLFGYEQDRQMATECISQRIVQLYINVEKDNKYQDK